MAKKRKQYTDEFKIEAVTPATAHGYSVAEACRKLDVSPSMVARWRSN